MNNLDNILYKINQIELNTDLTNKSVLGENIWPIIRLSLVSDLREKIFDSSKKKKVFSNSLVMLSSLFHIFRIFNTKKIIIFTHGVDSSAIYKLKNKVIHKQWSPLIDKFGSKHFLTIQLGLVSSIQNQFKNTFNINLLYLIFSFINYPLKLRRDRKINKELATILENINEVHNSQSLINDVNKFFNQRSFFRVLFKVMKPRALFLKGFGDINSFSIISAANNLNIDTIDYQHGQQGENNLFYSNWLNLPVKGYKMLPKYFWLWEETFIDKFKKWTQNQDYHEAFVGGNLWIEFIKDKINFEGHKLFSTDKKHALVCLQRTYLPKVIEQAMNKSEGIIWHFKLHPRENRNVDLLLEAFREKKVPSDKFELEVSNNKLFEELIGSVDVVISEWSTVCYESILYGKKGIVIHENGKTAFKKHINKKNIFYTENALELIEYILRDDSLKYNFIKKIDVRKINQILKLK